MPDKRLCLQAFCAIHRREMRIAMPSRAAAIWASATGAAIAVAGAAAAYWARPAAIWPNPAPPEVTGRATKAPAPFDPAAPLTPQSGAPAPIVESTKPAFDVVTVRPTGEAVVAGRAAPNARVELKDNGETVAEATANSEGQFVMIPAPLPPGEHSLSLAAGAGPSLETSNPIVVAVAAPEPAPKTASPASPAPQLPASAHSPATTPAASAVAIQSIEASADGRLIAKGVAAPNALVRLYVSGAFVGDAKTTADGHWSLTIEHGMTPGAYAVRADEISPHDAKVVARAEAPFNYPATPAQVASAGGSAAPSPQSPSPADVVVGAVQTHHVEPGHTLWGISQKFYGDGARYQLILSANSNQIRDPHWIYPGQTFVVPQLEPKP